MRLNPMQMLQIKMLRNHYIEALERWSDCPQNFDCVREALLTIGSVMSQCSYIVERDLERYIQAKQTSSLTHCTLWHEKRCEKRLTHLSELVVATLFNQELKQKQKECIARNSLISNLSAYVEFTSDPATRSITYQIDFTDGTSISTQNLNDDHVLGKFQLAFDDAMTATARYRHRLILAEAHQ